MSCFKDGRAHATEEGISVHASVSDIVVDCIHVNCRQQTNGETWNVAGTRARGPDRLTCLEIGACRPARYADHDHAEGYSPHQGPEIALAAAPVSSVGECCRLGLTRGVRQD